MYRHIRYIRYIFLLSLLLASFIGATATADRVVVTSGRVVYDAFGRAVKVYHPTVATDSVYDFSAAIDTVPPTVTEYDVLDRPVRVIYPDGTETNTSYSVAGHALVAHVTDALDNESETHVSDSGRTLKSIQYDGAGQIVTSFTYDGIGRLVAVMDADSNVTVSEYDMGDRRVRVSHPASGETMFTYDALGNVLTRQTANLRDRAQFIEYGYDRGRLVSVSYPEHPENDVRYYYGGANDPDNAKGRLCLRLDATGGEQYAYDDMGNVKKTVRTVTVPDEDVGTFKTEFEYDSFGKLLSLTYPDGEKVCYWYDGSGQLTEVYVKERKNGYRYVEEIGYDKFGDRVYMRYGNGAETEYAYNDEMRRLDSLSLASPHTTLKRIYGYDDVGNILSVTNSGTGLLYTPPVSHTYVYDNLYRLTEAHGTTGTPQTGYDLSMSYDNMYRITGKTQSLRQTGIQFAGTLNAGYDLAYAYDRTPGRRFRMSSVSDVNYRTVGDPEDGDYIDEEHFYEYDPNGNILHVNTGRWKRDGVERELSREEKFRWDEENRLMAISQDGYVSNYWYDGNGERVIKEHGGNHAVFVNSAQDGVLTDTRQFTIYPSAYLTVHNGSWYTKHVYIGSERIASRMGTMLDALSETFEANAILAGENVFEDMDYDDRCDTLARVMRSNYAYFDLPYNGYNRHGEEMVSTPPQSGDPGILGAGGVRHYWMLADADAADADGEGGGPSRGPRRAENVNYNGNRYFYHNDHLGSSSLITDASGSVTQQLDYLPYGEVFLEKRSQDPDVDYFTPYRFNGKELDEETGLYYYGARYMNPRLSIWYGCDSEQELMPNISTYAYCKLNPVSFIDPTGNGWIENNKRYFYNPLVSSQYEANKEYGNSAVFLFEEGMIYATDNSYSYNLERGGHIRNTFTNEIIVGEITTQAGSTLVNDNRYFSQKELDLWERWSESDNYFAEMAYDTANDLFFLLQIVSLGALDREQNKNPFTGSCFRNIDGTSRYDPNEAIPGLAGMSFKVLNLKCIRYAVPPKGLVLMDKMNASQFSHTFKGNLSRLKPADRGKINSGINFFIDYFNNKIDKGYILLKDGELKRHE